jgi:hypothetical protein
MKLKDIVPLKGTYVGLRVLSPANSQLYSHFVEAKIPVKKPTFDKRLHTTVIYSRKHCPALKAEKGNPHIATFSGYDLFTGLGDERVLVARLNAPSIVGRHLILMAEHGATYDYPEYVPHITICYDFKGDDTAGIPPINFPILLGEEYVEDLDLTYKD